VTLRIERSIVPDGTRIRLSGELRSPQLVDVSLAIARSDRLVALDLDELEHVDIDGVRFLDTCEAEGIELVNCSPYLREWISQERARKQEVREE
jgi:hypothetical protein